MQELKKSFKDAPDELYDKLRWEISYSTLIIAGDVKGNYINTATTDIGGMKLFLLFTDMDEYRKVFPDFSVEAHSNPFLTYFNLLKEEKTDGVVVCSSTIGDADLETNRVLKKLIAEYSE
jgi:hypothetical protein